MASLKEIKSRINSVNGTLKITSAMKMVASAKLHKAQAAIANMVPYERQMHEILYRLLSDESTPTCAEYVEQRPVKKVAIVAVSSNSSLCGAFNSNVIRLFFETAQEYLDAGLTRDDILVYPVGRKVATAVSKDGYVPQGDFNHLADRHIYDDISAFAESLTGMYLKGEIDRVELVYSHYKSSSSQYPVRETYLPFAAGSAAGSAVGSAAGSAASAVAPDAVRGTGAVSGSGGGEADPGARRETGSGEYFKDYLIEPDSETVLRALLPKVLVLKINTMLLDANAAEHAARTVAMQEASDNGRKLLQDLSLQYNKQRQQSITDELLDIVSGSLA